MHLLLAEICVDGSISSGELWKESDTRIMRKGIGEGGTACVERRQK